MRAEKVFTISCNGKNGTGTRNRGWQIVELCINKKQAIEKTKNESKTEQNVRTEKEESDGQGEGEGEENVEATLRNPSCIIQFVD